MRPQWRYAIVAVAIVVTACSDDSARPSSSGTRVTTTSRVSRAPEPTTTTGPLIATADDLHRCDRTLEPYLVDPPEDTLGFRGQAVPHLEGESLVVGGDSGYSGRVATAWGDLDGDGTPDTLAADFDAERIVVVSGAVPPGAELRKVGVTLEGTSSGMSFVVPVGDRNGDGADDVAFNGRIVSGRALLAHRPGSTIPMPREFATVPYLITAVRLDAEGPPALARIFGQVDLPPTKRDPIEIKLEGAQTTCLVTGNPDIDPALDGSYGRIGGGSVVLTVDRIEGQRIVEYRYTTRDAWVVYRWNLDAA